MSLAFRNDGRAYGFFWSQSSGKRIREALRNMKAEPEVKIPEKMDFSLHHLNEVVAGLSGIGKYEGHKLLLIAREWKGKKANYMLKSILPEATNRETADILGDVFNLMYSCTEILGPQNKPIADIYFRLENGIYVSKNQVDTSK